MSQKKSSDSSPFGKGDITKLEAIIRLLGILIKIAKYLPWIVLGFAGINLALAVLYFTWWNNIAGGIFNSILAFAGLLFFGQLVRRRTILRYKYGPTRSHLLHTTRKIDEKEEYTERQGSSFNSG